MTSNKHPEDDADRDVAGMLKGIGDDHGRPLPKTPEERLAQARTSERRRRTALAGVAGLAAAAVLAGGLSLWGNGGGVVRTESAAAPTNSTSDNVARNAVLAGKPLLLPTDLPTQIGWQQRIDEEDASSEGECDAPLSTRVGYQSRLLSLVLAPPTDMPTMTADPDAATLDAAPPESATTETSSAAAIVTATPQSNLPVPDPYGFAMNAAGQESTAQAAQQVWNRTISAVEACLKEPNDNDAVSTDVERRDVNVPGASQAAVWRMQHDCMEPFCEIKVNHFAVVRVGRVLVSLHLGSNVDLSTEEADAVIAKAVRRAVAD